MKTILPHILRPFIPFLLLPLLMACRNDTVIGRPRMRTREADARMPSAASTC